jgi:hypothetical protein
MGFSAGRNGIDNDMSRPAARNRREETPGPRLDGQVVALPTRTRAAAIVDRIDSVVRTYSKIGYGTSVGPFGHGFGMPGVNPTEYDTRKNPTERIGHGRVYNPDSRIPD